MSLEERVKGIPGGGGWWNPKDGKSFLCYAQILIGKGFSEDEAVDFLEKCFNVVVNAFRG
jgi:hypothetical protein